MGLPSQILWLGAGGIATVCAAVVGWFWVRHKRQIATVAMLVEQPQLPVILVIGPHAAALFSRNGINTLIRQDEGALWLHVDRPDQLSQAITRIRQSQHCLPQAVLLPLLLDGNVEDVVLRNQFIQWQYVLSKIDDLPPYQLPCYVAVYANLGGQCSLYSSGDVTWFGEDVCNGRFAEHDLHRSVRNIRQQLEQGSRTSAPESVRRNALGQALLDWLSDTAMVTTLSQLAATRPFVLGGMLLADVTQAPLRCGAWSRWITEKTGLDPGVTISSGIQALPLPAPQLSAHIPSAIWYRPIWRVACLALCLAMVTLCISFLVAAWNSTQILKRVTNNLAYYTRLPEIRIDDKHAALRVLETDRSMLQEYAEQGGPAGLNWGLYRAGYLLPLISDAINSYRSPVIDVVTLDTVMLFDIGQSTLRVDAAKTLNQALLLIQANRGRNVLITGHTDNIGDVGNNILLSEKRARAVRDWFVKMSDLPVTHFAIQGYGSSRPLATNDAEVGRARNRRVEIMLLRDAVASM